MLLGKMQELVERRRLKVGKKEDRRNEARERVKKEEGAGDILLGMLQSYKTEDVATKSLEDLRGTREEDEDELVKLIRVLANLSIHPTVGIALASNTLCVQLLLEVMGKQE